MNEGEFTPQRDAPVQSVGAGVSCRSVSLLPSVARGRPDALTPLGFYVASRHADVTEILRDKRFGKDFVGRMTRRSGPEILEEPVYRSMSHWMLQLDPPDHGRLRGLVVCAFTARRMEDMRPRIQQIVDDIIDRVEPRGRMDLIADFAFRLPVTVICDMLGIPEERRDVFFTSSRAGGRLLDLAPLSKAEIEEQNSYNLAMAEYFQGLFELRRRQPGNDLTTHLVQAEENGNKLTNEELTANIILLFGAGHETTVNLIGNGLLALYRNPDQLRVLKNDPSHMANAIEELLRYDSSVQVTGRTTLEDVEEIGGIRLEKGQSVVCLLGSANRDLRFIGTLTGSTSPDATCARCRSAGASIIALAPNWPASRARLRLRHCCVACQSCGLMTSIIPIGGRHLCCAASTSYQLVGRSSPDPPA